MRSPDLFVAPKHSNRQRLLAAAIGVGVLFAFAGGPADAVKKSTKKVVKKAATTTTAAPVPESAPPTTAAPAKPLFSIGKSQLGDILTSNDGLTLYNFDPDAKKPGGSACNSPCSDIWPPMIVKSDAELVAPAGFTGKLSTVKRDDGSLQAAVNGWPIYGWVFDKKAGDLNGQANNEVWWALSPAGEVLRKAPTIRFRGNKLGTATAASQMMVGTSGQTLYMYEPDKQKGVSTCYDQCAFAWPPLMVASKADLTLLQGHGIDVSKVTLFPRADLTGFQVAYDGWPLYYWFQDSKPGETKGQAVNNVWWVLDTAGKPVRTK